MKMVDKFRKVMMSKDCLLAGLFFIFIIFSCKKESPLPEKPVFSYNLENINSFGYNIKLTIDHFDQKLNYLYLWNLGTGKYYSSSSLFYTKVYSKASDLDCYFDNKGPHNIQLTAINENGETTNNASFSIKITDSIANFQGTINSTKVIKYCKFFAKHSLDDYYEEIYTCTGNNATIYNYNFTLNLVNNTVILPIYGKEYYIFVYAYYENNSYSYTSSLSSTFALDKNNKINFTAN